MNTSIRAILKPLNVTLCSMLMLAQGGFFQVGSEPGDFHGFLGSASGFLSFGLEQLEAGAFASYVGHPLDLVFKKCSTARNQSGAV